MATDKFYFEHPVGLKDARAVAKRRATLLSAVPDISKSYDRLSRNTRLAALKLPTPVLRETLDFYNAVVTDGRYVKYLVNAPATAAEKLGKTLSAAAQESLARVIKAVGPGTVEGPVEAVIAVAVVIACARPSDGVVLESNGFVSAKL